MKTMIFNTIQEVVSEVCEVSVEELTAQQKTDEIVEARTILIWFCKEYGLHSNDITKFVKRKRKNTVNEYLAKYHIFRKSSPSFRYFTAKISKILTEKFAENEV